MSSITYTASGKKADCDVTEKAEERSGCYADRVLMRSTSGGADGRSAAAEGGITSRDSRGGVAVRRIRDEEIMRRALMITCG